MVSLSAFAYLTFNMNMYIIFDLFVRTQLNASFDLASLLINMKLCGKELQRGCIIQAELLEGEKAIFGIKSEVSNSFDYSQMLRSQFYIHCN